MDTVGLLVTLEAKAGKEDELASFLAGALPLVQRSHRRRYGSPSESHPRGSRSSTPSPATPAATHTFPAKSPTALIEAAPELLPEPPASKRSTSWPKSSPSQSGHST